jgi:hypothetical protein
MSAAMNEALNAVQNMNSTAQRKQALEAWVLFSLELLLTETVELLQGKSKDTRALWDAATNAANCIGRVKAVLQ